MNATVTLLTPGPLELIGRSRNELPTPVMLLDFEAAVRNIARLAQGFTGSTKLRPHGKSHKCAELARMQLDRGAIGITTATAWEAVSFARAGVKDILVANEIAGADQMKHLAIAAREARITVAIDDGNIARALAAAAHAAGAELGVVIDVDVGMARGGVRTLNEARALAHETSGLSGIVLRGVMGYEGQCALDPDLDSRRSKATAAMTRLLEVRDSLVASGFPIEIVSAGGTATAEITGRMPGVTEIQAGSYTLMDNARRAIAPDFETALTVLCTVVSRHGNTLVLDGGRKTVGLELAAPSMVGRSGSLRKSSDEHLIFEVDESCELRPGDRVDVIPGYLPTTVSLHEAYVVMKDGYAAELWPVLARGAGHPWVP